MASVGVRELRQRASELLRLVEAGETIEVTDRGRPVALLTPLPAVTGLERLRASGELSGPLASLDELPGPLVLSDGQPTASEILAAMRRSER
jgi:prevent-host-death family protein